MPMNGIARVVRVFLFLVSKEISMLFSTVSVLSHGLSVVPQRFMHVVACDSLLFKGCVLFHCLYMLHFCYPFIH